MAERNCMKGKKGLLRILNACRYSRDGFLAVWHDEEAFRQIALLACVGMPLACVVGKTWGECMLLALPLVICLLVELLNSAIENAIDRISLEHHPLSKKAKDMGSAAQFLAQTFLLGTWITFAISRFTE